MHADHRLHFEDASGDFDEAQSQVSNWATRHIDRFGIEARRPHISQ